VDFGTKKARFSFEPLEMREVPAVLGQVVELPDAAAPTAEIALTAPFDLGHGVGAGIKIDAQSLVNVKLDPSRAVDAYLKIKLDDVLVSGFRETASASVKLDPQSLVSKKIDLVAAGATPDSGAAGRVQLQDFHFTSTVNKSSP
jgi:type VI protein secretion system component Hcp